MPWVWGFPAAVLFLTVLALNFVGDIVRQPTEVSHSYYDRGSCIQMKSASRGTIIAGNRIVRCNIGIVFGGEGLASPEHFGGLVQNNLILQSQEMAIAVVNATGGAIRHNTLFANGTSLGIYEDVRFPGRQSRVDIYNNILDGPIDGSAGAGSIFAGNYVLTVGEAEKIFQDAAAGNLRLAPGAKLSIDKASGMPRPLFMDFDGQSRPWGEAGDIGAFEYRRRD
jgi:hypothetical protein